MSWEEFWGTIVDFFKNNIWTIFWFVLVLIVGIIVIRLLLMVIRRIMRRHKLDLMAINFISAIIRFVLILILVLVLLSILGIPINGITTAFSAVVLSIGVALKDFLSNLASGIILITSAKYKAGDFVQVSGVEGSIVDINFLFTTLKTYDSTQVTLPNSTMVNSAVTNLGAYPLRRVAITFTVAYESDTDVVKETLLRVMNSDGRVYQDPPAMCRLKELGESSINFFCTCYCDNEDYWDVFYYIMEHGFNELKRSGIVFPFKQIELTNKVPVPMPIPSKELPARVEKKREVDTFRGLTLDEIEDMGFKEFSDHMKDYSEYKKSQREKEKQERKNKRKKKQEAKKEE